MDVLNPICDNCNGSGNDGAGVDPICKGKGRVEMSEESHIHQWVQWVTEQPTVEKGAEVLRRLSRLHTPPKGLLNDGD